MTCRDAERLIDTFFDGELDGRLMREAALHVTRCARCERELSDREQVHDLLVDAIDEEIDTVDLGRVWRGVEAGIAPLPVEAERSWLRLAAGSARLSGILVGRGASSGRRAARVGSVDIDATLDPAGEWLAPQAPLGARSWPLAGAVAIAASLLVTVLLLRGGDPREEQIAAQPAAGPAPVQLAARAEGQAAPGRVQVESVDYPGGSLAMWSEPETDTTVIWLDDDGSAAVAR